MLMGARLCTPLIVTTKTASTGPGQGPKHQDQVPTTQVPPLPPAPASVVVVDRPATRLLRGLLGDAVPAESSSSYDRIAPWWDEVCQAVDKERRRRVYGLIDGMQRRALGAVADKARGAAASALPELCTRFQKLGLSASDLRTTLAWLLAGAPTIIHLKLKTVLGSLVADTHYRNQFETGTSGGILCETTRKRWENDMFASRYRHAKPPQRVKYGVLNAVNSAEGIQSASFYGASYLELKQDVRLRSTFGHGDSGDSEHRSDDLGVAEAYAHLMAQWKAAEIRHVVAIAREAATRLLPSHNHNHGDGGGGDGGNSEDRWIYKPSADASSIAAALPKRDAHPGPGVLSAYQEMQVHGPVELAKDVARLVVHTSHKGDAAMVTRLRAFGEKHGVPVIWMEEAA